MLPRLPSYRVRIVVIAIAIFALWLTGLSDHLQEQSFDEFQWLKPDAGINSISLILQGKSVEDPSFERLETVIRPRCDKPSDQAYNLLIIVKSTVSNSQNREAIRKTWGAEKSLTDFSVRTIFIVGRFLDEKTENNNVGAIKREAEIFNDILQGDIIDSYRNNTLKFIHSIHYAHSPDENCPKPDFVLLIDDDYMLSINHLISLLDSRTAGEPLYEGWRFDTSPFRFRLHKHSVSVKNWPYDRYPAYITAGAVLLSYSTVEKFYQASKVVKIYSFDDVYAGILAHLLRIEARHNDAFVFWTRTIDHDDWTSGKVIAAHGYDANTLEQQYPLVKYSASG